MRKPAGIVLSLLLLAVLAVPYSAQQHPGAARVSRLLLIIPFENTSNVAGTDWISESFPEVLSMRLGPGGFFIMGRDDRLNAFDRLCIPPGDKPSRATLYQVGQQLDADYLVLGDYRVEQATITEAIASGTQPARMPLDRIKRNYDESTFRQIALEIENTNEARLAKSDSASHAAFHVRHGQELLQSGLPGEAEKEFREAVVLDPSSPGAHAGFAAVLETDQDIAGARNEARMSLKLQPTAEVYLLMARLDMAENKTASAAQNVEHALALDPANAAAVALKRDIALGAAGKAQSSQP